MHGSNISTGIVLHNHYNQSIIVLCNHRAQSTLILSATAFVTRFFKLSTLRLHTRYEYHIYCINVQNDYSY